MSDEEKTKPRHPETNFLPPLDMILTFFDKKKRKRGQQEKTADEKKKLDGKNVEKLIEKLSEKEK
jgi:hypothetical protein